MHPVVATPFHTEAIYALLHDARFHNLPALEDARPIIEESHSMVVEREGRVVFWAGFHGSRADGIHLDLVVAPDYPRNLITKGLVKQILAYGFSLTHDVRMVVECYNPKSVKAALAVGFALTPENAQKPGWVRLALQLNEFERKFGTRG